MAYQYDEMGNVVGEYESEEERKAREEAAANEVATKHEVTTYADGSQTKTTKEELPATPTMTPVGAPVNPAIFDRMRQVESGNQNYNQSGPNIGQPVTSPKGAMFASQVMPATANNPGYGVAPATAQTPEEYNRVGQEYYQAMLKHFNGDERKATAAYNAGPGAIQKNMAANAGQMNESQLPKETQGYLGKVLGGQAASAVAPQALPSVQQYAQPAIQTDDQGNKLITNPDGTTSVLGPDNKPMTAGGQVPTDTAQYKQRLFDEAGQDPFKWMQLSQDATQPPGFATVAKEQARNLLQQQFQMDSAKEQVAKTITAATNGDAKAGRAIADELKNQNGSWAKMILLGFLSPALAGEEAVKLGFGNKWQSVTNDKGESALIQVNAKGLPLKGISADNTELNSQQLASFATGGKKELDLVGGSYINDKTGEVGRMVSDKKTGQTYIQTDTGRKGMSGFRPQSSTGGLSDMRARQIQELNIKLQGKTEEEKMAILRPYNQQLVGAGAPAIDPSEVGIRAPQIGAQQAAPMPQGGAVAPQAMPQAIPGAMPQGAPQGAAVAPMPLTQAPQGRLVQPGARPTMSDIEASKTKAKEAAQEEGVDLGKVKVNQGKSEQNADYLITKVDELVKHPGFETSVGRKGLSYGFGLAKEPLLEGTDASDWQARLKEVQGQSFLQAIENLRGMGALSDMEGKSATKAIQRMSTSQSEGEFKSAAQDFKEIIERGIDRNRVKLGQKPLYGTEAESKQKPMNSQDKNAIEWVRNNPNDPRAATIKKRLGL